MSSKEEQIASLQSELAQLRNSREEYVVMMRDALVAAEDHCGAVHGGYGTEQEIAESHQRFSELCMKYYKHKEDDTVLGFIDMRDYATELKARAEKAESELKAVKANEVSKLWTLVHLLHPKYEGQRFIETIESCEYCKLIREVQLGVKADVESLSKPEAQNSEGLGGE